MSPHHAVSYFETLAAMPLLTRVTGVDGASQPLEKFYATVIEWCREAHDAGNAIHFVGNGGSAAVASHMANDFCKNGGMRARAHNDASALTCLANDYSFDEVFARQIEMHAGEGDIVIAISSSGASYNILGAVEAAREAGCRVITLSGFSADNPLRRSGDLNAYVPSADYGFVEIAHLALCHAIVDLANGWQPATSPKRRGAGGLPRAAAAIGV